MLKSPPNNPNTMEGKTFIRNYNNGRFPLSVVRALRQKPEKLNEEKLEVFLLEAFQEEPLEDFLNFSLS